MIWSPVLAGNGHYFKKNAILTLKVWINAKLTSNSSFSGTIYPRNIFFGKKFSDPEPRGWPPQTILGPKFFDNFYVLLGLFKLQSFTCAKVEKK